MEREGDFNCREQWLYCKTYSTSKICIVMHKEQEIHNTPLLTCSRCGPGCI